MSLKISAISHAEWLWSLLFLSLFLQFVWGLSVSYPAAFERELRRGKSWVYVPLRWKGLHKILTISLSRLLLLAIAFLGMALFTHYTRWQEPAWVQVLMAAAILLIAARFETLWTTLRYRQQEDAYYLLHDELRLKLDREGKDYTGAQFRSLAAYQHQQRLRKSDESGKFLSSLRREARLARQLTRHSPASLEPVEN